MEKVLRELSQLPRNIEPIYTPWNEYAWKYSDFPELLRYFQENAYIVLGGDILTMELKYTYDNWYYNPDPFDSKEENVRRSIAAAEDYLTNYKNRNGTDYYIVFVVTRRFP